MLVGSSLQAGLVAGLLARVHKRKVYLAFEPSIGFRLARELPLSVDCITRPETWQLLAQSRAEAFKLLTSIGGGKALGRINPVIVATTFDCAQALAHMFHVVKGYGFEIEQETIGALPAAKKILRIRGARIIQHKLFRPALGRWLADGGVRIGSVNDLTLSIKRGGQVVAKMSEGTIQANRLVLADEEAIRAHAKPQYLNPAFVGVSATTLACEPTPALSEKYVLNPFNRFRAYGQANNGYEIVSLSLVDEVATDIVASLPDGKKLRPAGRAVFNTCVSSDGAPFAGKLGQSGAWAVGGFGNTGAFVAPAIARFLAGKTEGLEEEYFSKRCGGAKRASRQISEYQHIRAGG